MKRERDLFYYRLFDSHTHCEGIDIFNYINCLTPTVQDVSTLSERIAASKIDCAIVFPVQTTMYYTPASYLEGDVFRCSQLCEVPYEIENKRLLLNIHKFGCSNMLPFLSFSLNDKVNEQIEEMRKLTNQYEVYGLKYHTQTDQNRASRLADYPELISFIKENDFPIIFHSGKSDVANPKYILDLADRYPDIRMCVAHFGRFRKSFFEKYNTGIYKNVYLDIAPYDLLFRIMTESDLKNVPIQVDKAEKGRLLEALNSMYPNKIIWGSDMPWIDPKNLQDSVSEKESLTYEKVVNTLFEVSKSIRMEIASKNVLDFIFGINDMEE